MVAALAAQPNAATANGWDLLGTAEVTETGEDETWRAVKTFPDALVAAADGFEIEGYLVPVVPEPYLSTFLLVPDPANCPFCGDGGYGPVLEVVMRTPLEDMAEGTQIALQGQLEFNRDPETFQMFRLVDAVRIDLGDS